MSNFQFGKTKVAKTAKSIRDDNEQGGAPLVPATPDNDQQQNVSSEEQVEEQKTETPTDNSAKEQEVSQRSNKNPQQDQEPEEAADTAPVTNKALAAILRQKLGELKNKLFEAIKDKGTTNGIVVNVPMEDYFQLMMLKKIEKKTLKELALQAIHEFVERNRVM